MKKIKRIMAVLICMTITLTGIPVSVNAENSGGKSVQTMETGNELFITLEENTRYRWNVNDSAEKNSVVHLDTSGGDNSTEYRKRATNPENPVFSGFSLYSENLSDTLKTHENVPVTNR